MTAHLEVIAHPEDRTGRGLKEQGLELLAAGGVLTRSSLRTSLAAKNETLGVEPESLEQAGKIGRTAGGWQRLC